MFTTMSGASSLLHGDAAVRGGGVFRICVRFSRCSTCSSVSLRINVVAAVFHKLSNVGERTEGCKRYAKLYCSFYICCNSTPESCGFICGTLSFTEVAVVYLERLSCAVLFNRLALLFQQHTYCTSLTHAHTHNGSYLTGCHCWLLQLLCCLVALSAACCSSTLVSAM
jgi:hypothetical protein